MYILDLNNTNNLEVIKQPYFVLMRLHYHIKNKYISHMHHSGNRYNSDYSYEKYFKLLQFSSFSNSTQIDKISCSHDFPCTYLVHHFIFSEISIFLFGLFTMYLLCYIYANTSNHSNTKIKTKTETETKTEIETDNDPEAKRIEEKTRKLEEGI